MFYIIHTAHVNSQEARVLDYLPSPCHLPHNSYCSVATRMMLMH